MEAGYDYLLLRTPLPQRFFQASGLALIAVGAVLLSAGIAYFIYAYKARADLDSLNAVASSLPRASDTVSPLLNGVAGTTSAVPANAGSSLTASGLGIVPSISGPQPTEFDELEQTRIVASASAAPVESAGLRAVQEAPAGFLQPSAPQGPAFVQLSAADVAAQQLYPGEGLRATYWNNPLEYEPPAYVDSYLVQGFKQLEPGMIAPLGTLASPTQLAIPAIGLDSRVEGLEILDLGDSRAYATPKNVVGHIPELANAGEDGAAWFFGHLESPLAGEGNVFYALPKIPDLLRRGEEVHVIVANGNQSYLYRITEAFVVHQDDLRMDYAYLQGLKPEFAQLDPNGANIHLVACVPKLVYDHRIVVSGELVGIRQ